MFWKKEKLSEKKLDRMNSLLQKSFSNVKRDTSNIFQWMNYFYQKNMEQEQTIKKLQLEISYIPKTREEIRNMIDSNYSFESLLGKIKGLAEKVEELAAAQKSVQERPVQQAGPIIQQVRNEFPKEVETGMHTIQKRLQKLEHKSPSFKEKIVKKLTRNSKDYIKGVMLSYIKKYEKVTALQLKEMVVDEQRFCSKSSFYRLLEEIEKQGEVGVIKQGKEKHYAFKSMRYTHK
jgi:DNA repair ATPase RecN